MKTINNKKLLSITFLGLAFILILTEPSLGFINKGYFNHLENSLLAPLFFFLLGLTVSLGILLLFKEAIFQKWLRNILFWHAPLSVILISTGATGSYYAWFQRTDLAIFSAVSLVAITLIFCLLQNFYFKLK
jgi:ABC-type transport system involved in multi-copper enzyme maturation permease subunit